ncbi:hypothetical protein MRB53_032028 [Persea americana]|uniref:Uncharacterized protein n=1 Tax=Persea americana TaxID=3435 RepID=A0ACC2KQN4_PERAE|nr:hypothetical protein MRB53_032028 [Persea americana]
MENMESFVKDKIDAIQKSLEAKEMAFEKLLQEERENAKRSNADSGSNEECKLRALQRNDADLRVHGPVGADYNCKPRLAGWSGCEQVDAREALKPHELKHENEHRRALPWLRQMMEEDRDH